MNRAIYYYDISRLFIINSNGTSIDLGRVKMTLVKKMAKKHKSESIVNQNRFGEVLSVKELTD